MAIWKRESITLEELNNMRVNTLSELLDMHFIEIGDNFLKLQMPVDKRTHKPYGLLHGGASAALAETVGRWPSGKGKALPWKNLTICVSILCPNYWTCIL